MIRPLSESPQVPTLLHASTTSGQHYFRPTLLQANTTSLSESPQVRAGSDGSSSTSPPTPHQDSCVSTGSATPTSALYGYNQHAFINDMLGLTSRPRHRHCIFITSMLFITDALSLTVRPRHRCCILMTSTLLLISQ